MEYRDGEDRTVTGAPLPVNERGHGSRVTGHVCDIGEAAKAVIPFERVSITTYPNRCGIPNEMLEEGMVQRKRTALELAHPNVAVSPDRDDEPGWGRRASNSKNAPQFDVRTYLFRLRGVDLTRINGINPTTVLKVIAEIGPDMSRFKCVKHFTSWLGVSWHKDFRAGQSGLKRLENRNKMR